MIDHIQNLSGKRVLLLQGPVGPFFARLAADLRRIDARVFKVNFHAGDWFYYRRGAFSYRGAMEDWPDRFAALLDRWEIDVVLLFGDCRPIHRSIHSIAVERGVEIGVFEEGYVRPDYVTLERLGVNAYSPWFREPDPLREEPPSISETIPVGNTYWAMVWHGGWYFGVGGLGKLLFPRYQHHRPLTITEILPWIRSLWRKLWYRRQERGIQEALAARWKGRYFLVPLQVFNDHQLTVHANWDSIEHFIEATLRSFAGHAPNDTLLVFKHHPLERGYRDYTALIGRLSLEAGISRQVRYIHDQHLPTLLSCARGVVIINSTVGLSAIDHGAPTKALGRAIYDTPGLTFQGPLDEFWTKAPAARPDPERYRCFRANLIARTQLNGSFYKPFKRPDAFAGLLWRHPSPKNAP